MTQETELLLHVLDVQRSHVLGILEGLSDEHHWFRCIAGGESLAGHLDAARELRDRRQWIVM
jgi:hypothetical protein